MRRLRTITLTGVLALLVPAALIGSEPTQASSFGYTHLKPIQKRLLSGTASFELDPAMAAARAGVRSATTQSLVSSVDPCSYQRGKDVKVNQNCLNVVDADLQGRSQAQNETSISVDPNNSQHLVASYNDYRRGDGTCGTSFSLDGGKTWNDSTAPNGFTRGDFTGTAREYWQGSGDTSVSWDSHGNAYLSCQMFNRGSATSPNPDQSSAFYVFRSTGSNGASWNFPGRLVEAIKDTAGAGTALEDKQLITVDSSKTSAYRDRIYVTWTRFTPDGTGYIYEAHSADYGETFSKAVLVSKNSPLCTNNFGFPTPHGSCNENQFSQPFTAPDGTLYVAYANFNNSAASTLPGDDGRAKAPGDNRTQMLVSRSVDGGASFSAPVKAGDFYDLPDCAAYQGGQDPGRACVPEKGSTANSIFRASNYPSGAVNPRTGQVTVTYGSYINRHSNETNGCVPQGFSPDFGTNLYTGVKVAGACNNDILISTSTDEGRSFTGSNANPRHMPTVTNRPAQATSDQYFQWAAYSPSGQLVVSYRDRQYGDDETTGYDDVSLSSWAGTGYAVTRATTSSMPPPTEFGGAFAGDYEGLTVSDSMAHPIWTDSRARNLFLCEGTGTTTKPPRVCTATAPNAPYANDEDAYTAALPLP